MAKKEKKLGGRKVLKGSTKLSSTKLKIKIHY